MKLCLLSFGTGLLLTRLFPFLFGTRIYDEKGWRVLAPSALLLGPASMVTLADKILSLSIDALVFAAIIFGTFQVVRYALRPR